ncbi:MAG: DUF3024 domain-containing protein [Actinomycetota bacterium]
MLEEATRTVEAFCSSRVPEGLRDEIRIECTRRGKSITIVERRPPWNPDFGPEWSETKVAQLRLDDSAGTWSLYCPDSNGRWHDYDRVGPSQTVEPLLAEVEADPTGIFWG